MHWRAAADCGALGVRPLRLHLRSWALGDAARLLRGLWDSDGRCLSRGHPVRVSSSSFIPLQLGLSFPSQMPSWVPPSSDTLFYCYSENSSFIF